MEMEATSPDWADGLPLDMLLCVRDLLGVHDRVRLAAVCRPWRTSLLPRFSMPSPWVLIPGDDGDTWDQFSLVSLPNNNSLKCTFTPEIRCVGSSWGWLALINANICITLVNPLMSTADVRARAVRLPPLWRSADGTVAADRFGLPKKTRTVCIPAVQRNFIERMAFSPDPSSGNYAAAVLCREWHGVAFTNSGRRGWQWLDWPLVRGEPRPLYPCPEDELDDRHISFNPDFDVVYHRGRFYYMTGCGRIWALDATAPAGTPVEPVLFAARQMPPGQLLRYGKHMVFSEDGALHVVWSDLNGMPRGSTKGSSSMVERWVPMRVERYEPGSPWGWREVQHLGGRAFLIGGRSQSVCLEEEAVRRKKTWLSPNCIYFTNILPLCNYEHTKKHSHIIEFNVVTRVFSTRNRFHYDFAQPNPSVDYPWMQPVELPAGSKRRPWAWTEAIWFTP